MNEGINKEGSSNLKKEKKKFQSSNYKLVIRILKMNGLEKTIHFLETKLQFYIWKIRTGSVKCQNQEYASKPFSTNLHLAKALTT